MRCGTACDTIPHGPEKPEPTQLDREWGWGNSWGKPSNRPDGTILSASAGKATPHARGRFLVLSSREARSVSWRSREKGLLRHPSCGRLALTNWSTTGGRDCATFGAFNWRHSGFHWPHGLPVPLWRVLRRALDHVADSGHASRQTRRRAMRAALARHALCAFRETRAPGGLRQLASD